MTSGAARQQGGQTRLVGATFHSSPKSLTELTASNNKRSSFPPTMRQMEGSELSFQTHPPHPQLDHSTAVQQKNKKTAALYC